MRPGGQEKTDTGFTARLSCAANWTVRIIGSAIFLAMSWYAMRYTQYIPQFYSEKPVNTYDSMLKNILVLIMAVLAIIVLFELEKRLPVTLQTWVLRIMPAALVIWIGVCGLWWITMIDRVPVGDQAFIYGGASYFIEGQYFFLEKSNYCDMCPHQLGLMALVELLFRFVGTYNYFACQLICVGMAVGIGIFGYLLVRQISGNMAVAVAYCLAMFACLPLIFYTSWVYGDIPSIFFILLAAYCLLKYEKSGHGGYLAGMSLSVLLAILVRENSIIMLIALCLAAGVYAIAHKDKKLFIALAVSVVLPGLVNAGIAKMYQIRSGTEPLGGMPAISYVAMGMQESDGKYGWYTQYCKEVYWAADSDPELAARVSRQDVKERLKVFLNDPSYAWLFYREKILSQWNQPMYQAMFFSAQYEGSDDASPDTIDAKLHGQYLLKVLAVCDRMQFILYVGMLCYYLFAVRKKSNILQHMLAVTIIGGFFFSILWEAKARYIFPYYVMMYPLAAIGYWQALRQVTALIDKLRGRGEEDNVIPFRRVA